MLLMDYTSIHTSLTINILSLKLSRLRSACSELSENLVSKFIKNSTEMIQMEAGRPGFEPGSKAPEAPMLSKLYHWPVCVRSIRR